MGGWVVGKSDFNENPVVSLDLELDLDFGLRLKVCQKGLPLADPSSEIKSVNEKGKQNMGMHCGPRLYLEYSMVHIWSEIYVLD